jgi:hypothetical protein
VTYIDLHYAATKRGLRVLLKSSHEGQHDPSQAPADLMVSVMGRAGEVGHTSWQQSGTRLDAACSELLAMLRAKKLVA